MRQTINWIICILCWTAIPGLCDELRIVTPIETRHEYGRTPHTAVHGGIEYVLIRSHGCEIVSFNGNYLYAAVGVDGGKPYPFESYERVDSHTIRAYVYKGSWYSIYGFEGSAVLKSGESVVCAVTANGCDGNDCTFGPGISRSFNLPQGPTVSGNVKNVITQKLRAGSCSEMFLIGNVIDGSGTLSYRVLSVDTGITPRLTLSNSDRDLEGQICSSSSVTGVRTAKVQVTLSVR